jgi:hypothetical protein
MVGKAIALARRRPVSAGLAAVVLATVLAIGASWLTSAARWAAFAAELAIEPKLAPASGGQAPIVSTFHFRYRGCTRFVTVEVPPAELDSDRALDTHQVFATTGPVRGAFLRTLVRERLDSAAVGSTVRQLRSARDQLGLDGDQYAEFIVRFVQSIPYGTVDGRVHPPAQVLAEGVGACDDRSVLLAVLLRHEGYDTALFVFDNQAHAAVGLRSTGPGFRDSGYAFVETNEPAFIGTVGGRYVGYAAWRPQAQVIRLGGRRVYSSEHEAVYVARSFERARALERYLRRYVGLAESGPAHWRAVYALQERRRVQAAQTVALIESYDFDRARLYEVLTSRSVR